VPIRAVLFDFGGVITRSPFRAIEDVGTAHGVEPAVVLDLVLGPYHEDTDHAFHRLERGEISAMEYGIDLVERARAAGIEVDWSLLGSLFSAMPVHDVVVDHVRRLRADGLRTALLTNNVAEAADRWRAMFPVEELFDVVVDSSSVGMRKPSPAIYRHTLEALGGVAPEEAAFLDDSEGNVNGARAVGIHAILVDDDPVPALAELDGLIARLAG
jgi:epoxide hydrolase-like predicted phosphatase